MEGGQIRTATHPWQAAFVAYCNGAPEDEISQLFDIPINTLRGRMQLENWPKLRAKLPLGTEVNLPAKINAKLEVINENRRVNFEVWDTARKHAVTIIQALAEGRLKIKRTIVPKLSVSKRKKGKDDTELGDPDTAPKDDKDQAQGGTPVAITVESEPTPADWLTIVTYLRTITEGTYRALGDFQGSEKTGTDANAAPTMPQAPAITIVLPGAIAAPREKRVSEGQVIEIQPVVKPA